MSEWNPQIVKIEKIEKHLNTENLSVATVLVDYPVVINSTSFKVGDLACYVPIDTLVPDTEQFHFLSPRSYERYEEDGEIKQRITGYKYPVGSVPENKRVVKAKKFFGVYSQGLLLDTIPNLNVEDSIIDALSLKKMEEENEENLPLAFKTRGRNAAPPPKGWSIPYYDLKSLRKYYKLVESEQDIILTEKLNGSHADFCFDGENLVIKSRNFYKKLEEDDDIWVELGNRLNLKEKLSKYPMMVLFGECINQVKKFRYNTNLVDGKLLTDLICFDIYDVKSARYLDYDNYIKIINELELTAAPQLYRGPWTSKEEIYSFAEGKSTLNNKIVREGFVLSLAKERYEDRLHGRLKLKLIGSDYNLSK